MVDFFNIKEYSPSVGFLVMSSIMSVSFSISFLESSSTLEYESLLNTVSPELLSNLEVSELLELSSSLDLESEI